MLVGGETFDFGAIPATIAARFKAISAVCTAHGFGLPVAVLALGRTHPLIKSIIPGPRNPGELAQILRW